MHFPGLKVVCPTTPYDAKGCLVAAIRDDDPVIFVEHRMVHFQKSHVPEEPYTVPLDRARILRPGTDLTIVGISHALVDGLRAAEALAAQGISAEVIDPVALRPLDTATIAESVRKTGRLLVVDSAWTFCGASAEIVAAVAERLGHRTGFAFRRMGFAPVVCPTSKALEKHYYPSAAQIAGAGHALVRPDRPAWEPDHLDAPEVLQFRGPF
jgi:pyruvate dehydrogenase E1 component beta subunit